MDLIYELSRVRDRARKQEDSVVSEAKKILKQDLFTDKKILQNLGQYKSSFETPDEENLDEDKIFTLAEIKKVAIIYRLKFLDGDLFKPEVPYEAGFKIEGLNREFHKEIKKFMMLAPYESFTNLKARSSSLLFVRTNYDNYYLVHSWGKPLKKIRKLKFMPLKNFESLVITVVLITLLIALSLPTYLITLDPKATYWSGYRAAAFFHLLIFDSGVTVYFTFTFAKNFSATVWNRYKDF